MAKVLWQDIPCTDGIYEVSNTGVIRSKTRNENRVNKSTGEIYTVTRKGRVLTMYTNNDGYLSGTIRVGKKNYNDYAHRFVAYAWKRGIVPRWCPCGGTGRDVVVDHKDEIRHNNHESNLAVTTRSYNSAKANQAQRRKKHKPNQLPPHWLLGFES